METNQMEIAIIELMARVKELEKMLPMYEQYKRDKSHAIRKNSIFEVQK